MPVPITAFISPGSSEFLLIMLVLILLFGAKDAPRIFRTLHTLLDKVQRAAAGFRYRIMYGDLQQDAPADEPYDVEETTPYDVEETTPDDSEECAEMEPETTDAEPGTENSKLSR